MCLFVSINHFISLLVIYRTTWLWWWKLLERCLGRSHPHNSLLWFFLFGQAIWISLWSYCVFFQFSSSGTRFKDYFNRHGDLKRIRRLKFWPLDCVLVERYNFTESDAQGFADFLRPILDFTPENRPSAAQCLKHPWLNWSIEIWKSN